MGRGGSVLGRYDKTMQGIWCADKPNQLLEEAASTVGGLLGVGATAYLDSRKGRRRGGACGACYGN